MVKILKTRHTILDKEQIKENLIKLASNNTIISNSKTNTYPIPRVKDNCKYINLVYTLLNEHIKMNIPIHPAGEWLLDNYYIIEKSAKTACKELSKIKYKNLPGIKKSGFSRIYLLANEIVSNTDGKIVSEDLIQYIEAYQQQKYLTMKEIWNIGLFLQICIIEKIRDICEKIFISQTQRYKAQNIVERLIENKTNKKIKIEVEGKYPFIEYMSYKLKSYGKISEPYLIILDEEVRKTGTNITEIINREHFDIAVKTLSIKNCITSIKEITRIELTSIFDKVNIVEKKLNSDPAKVYEKMDYRTKEYYRNKILELSEKTKLSEIYITDQIINLCNKKELKQNHVGYYLIDEGKKELLNKLLNKKVKIAPYKEIATNYIFIIYYITIIITIFLIKELKILSLLLFIPIQNSVTQVVQYILSKIKKTRLIPKLDFEKGIPEESTTMCIIPTIIKSKEDVKKMIEKMEVYYLANKSENLYFTLLGDCTASKKEKEKYDKEIIEAGKELTQKMNDKYGEIFFFTYRKREWSQGEKTFMGWERKRGLIYQYNEFLKTGKSKFLVNTCKTPPKIKYVITLDSDTNLTLNSAFELVGAMSHILNKPEVDKIKNRVIKGHAIIQPRIGINIKEARKTTFSRLFAGNGGTDLYTNAISDVYQDNFDEGIFTGKGIYDLDIFYQVLKDSIPENKILSHDLLEGNLLRCGLASDIVLMDGYPSNYNSYKIRKHRWIRGDIQILPWIKSELNTISKYKIIDNLVRNMNELFIFISILYTILTKSNILIPLLIYSIPMIIKIMDNILNLKRGTVKHRLFVSTFSKWTHTIYKYFVELTIIPDIAFLELNAISKSIYRMKISHSNMLEWTTAQEAEEQTKDKYKTYLKSMIMEDLITILLIIFFVYNFSKYKTINAITIISILILWKSSSLLMWALGKKQKEQKRISNNDKDYLLEIAKKTYKYFNDNCENNLPADNYQEDRKEKIALRTSPTNIGLAMLSQIAGYDLKIINLNEAIEKIEKSLQTIEKLAKWNGHLYNWYNIETLEPLHPYVISSVDSGNYIGYLYTVKQFLEENIEYSEKMKDLLKIIYKLIEQTNFKVLYNYKNGLFSIGFNIEENRLYDSYYDLLASEARQTSLIAIAKKDIPTKHWNNLGRTLTRLREHKGLVSWGGTAFEYLMPNINIPTYPSTLIDESCKLLVLSDKEYSKKMNIPWGISEAAYSLKDFYGNYQYKTFGIPWLGLKRGLSEDVVISPYSSALALTINSKEAIQNLKRIEKEGMIGKYGFYDSIDYKPKKETVKTFMAHHQGMILTSIDNAINNNIIQKRFMKNPEMQGIEILLQENMPEDVIITKEKKDKAKRIRYKGYEEVPPRTEGINVISSNELSNITNDKGNGHTSLGNIVINKEIKTFIKNLNTNKIYNINDDKKCEYEFKPYESKTTLEDGNLKTTIKTVIAPNEKVEIRKIEIENKGINSTEIELTTYTEPILSNIKDFNAHPSFNNMFLRYNYEESSLIVTRKSRKQNEKQLYLATTLYSENSSFEFEIDKQRFISRGNTGIPEAVINSTPLSKKIETIINPIIALKKLVKIKPKERKSIYLINSIEFNKENAIEGIKKYTNLENLNRVFELAKEQTEAEIRYLGLKEKDVSLYQTMIKYLLYSKQETFEKNNTDKYQINNLDLSNESMWKYGISGEYPLLTLIIKEQNDYYEVNELLKAYEYFLSKNLKTELVIITNSEIKNIITNSKISKYLNQKGGVFVIDDIKYEDLKKIELRSNILIDASKGTLKIQIEEMQKQEKNRIIRKENTKKEELKDTKRIKTNKIIQTKYTELKYNNEYGTFNSEKDEYWIKQSNNKKIPVAWSNIMANEQFGTVVTDIQGGFTWYINSQTNKITEFANDAYMDIPSEQIEILEQDKEENKEYYTGYGLGYSHFAEITKDIRKELTVFIPTQDSLKISILQIKNTSKQEKLINIKYKINFQMGESKDKSIIVENYKKNLNMIIVKNLMNTKYVSYITSNVNIDENKETTIKLKPNEEKEIVFLLGAEKDETECLKTSAKYINTYIKEFNQNKEYWKTITSKYISKTPLESFDIMLNGRLVYQTLVSRIMGRTGFYQSSGGYGYRDQIQDAIGMKWVDSNILKKQILLHAEHQFEKGDVEHWWHEDSKLGIRTRYSDDLLWLIYAIEEYIDFTGDYSILFEEVNYLEGEELKQDEEDRVDYYKTGTKKEILFQHCLKALQISIALGEHNLPLIKHGDWNDGMNNIGKKGKGESVWLGFFLYDILNRFTEILEYMENKKLNYDKIKNEFQEIILKLKKSLNNLCWDGRWFIRAFDDNGEKIGSNKNEECKIDSIAQSFAVLSKAGDNDKQYIAMKSLEDILIDNNNNLVKLLTPSLEKTNLGYISSYAKGMRENGGQYTHAAIWAIIAETLLNKTNEAMDIYKKINPIEHTKSKEGVEKYKVEPYALEADIYSEDNLAGRGGWTWYTGSSSWLYEAQIKYILGIKIYHGKLQIKPCVPKDWTKFELTFKWKQAIYKIKYNQIGEYKVIINPEHNLQINEDETIQLKETGQYEINLYF